jgi:hypothetical protein
MLCRQVRSLVICAITALVAFSSLALANSLSSESYARKHTNTPDSEEPSRPDERGTYAAPLIIRQIPVEKDKRELAEAAADRDEKRWNDRLTIYIAGGTAVILFFQFVAFLIQAKMLRRTITTMDKTAERQLRAYVYVDNAYFEQLGAITWRITYKIKNFGQTPAHNVRLVELAQVVEWNDGNPGIPQPTDSVELGSIAPGGDFFENEARLQGYCRWQDLYSGATAIYLVGIIRYRDVFHQMNAQPVFVIILEAMLVATAKRCSLIVRAMTLLDCGSGYE